MDRDRFYAIIDEARTSSDPTSPSADPDALREILAGLDASEVAAFARGYENELVRLNRWSVWGAGYVSEGGLSDDGFHYFRSWLIGKGSTAVEAALEDPDSLADFFDESEHENEELEYVSVRLLGERGLPNARAAEGEPHADDIPAGEPFDEETVESAYPRIAARVALGQPDPSPQGRGPRRPFWRRFRK